MSVFTASILFSVAMFSVVSAEGVELRNNIKVESKTEIRSTTTEATSTSRDNATSSSVRNNYNATSSDDKKDGDLNGESHRSTVASFVQSLLSIANREGGIGSEVRTIAKAQNDSASTSAKAITETNDRGGFRTFLFGTDYKNLGILRSEMITTDNNILKLKNLLDRAVDASDKIELSAQIKVLENTQIKIAAFIKAHEDSFSLLGWLVKPFSK